MNYKVEVDDDSELDSDAAWDEGSDVVLTGSEAG